MRIGAGSGLEPAICKSVQMEFDSGYCKGHFMVSVRVYVRVKVRVMGWIIVINISISTRGHRVSVQARVIKNQCNWRRAYVYGSD